MTHMPSAVLFPAELVTIPHAVTVSCHDREEQAARAALELRAALRARGVPDSDYRTVAVQSPSSRGFCVQVTSEDADQVVMATCLDALLRRSS